MKIAVIGGGSTYTPELIEGFARRQDLLPVDELVLHDIDEARLDVVGGLARRILDEAGFSGRLTFTADRSKAVDSASAVLVQLRVGGQAARLTDETLPNKHGLIGQETTGPGGFFKALRTLPVVLDLADEVHRRAAPGAWIVDFTNPVGIVTRALLDAGSRAVGLCNVAVGFQRRLAAHFGVPAEQVVLDYAGLNHLSWIRSVQVDGTDRLPELLQGSYATELAAETGIPIGAIRALRAIPSYYLRYFYCTDSALAEQLQGGHRAEHVAHIENELLTLYADPALKEKPALLAERGGAYYSEAAAALVTSLLTGDGARHYVDVRNNGTVPGLPDEAVVEVPATVGTAGPAPEAVAALAPEMLGLVQAVTSYEVLTIEAARTGSRETALRALMANPLIRQWDIASAVLEDMLAANTAFLPAFSRQRHD